MKRSTTRTYCSSSINIDSLAASITSFSIWQENIHYCQLVFPCVHRKVSSQPVLMTHYYTDIWLHSPDDKWIHPWWCAQSLKLVIQTWSTNGFAFVGWPNWDWECWAVSRKQTPVVSNLFMSVPWFQTCPKWYLSLLLPLTLCWQSWAHCSLFTLCLWRCWLFPGLFTNEWAGITSQGARPASAHQSCNWYYAIIVTGLGTLPWCWPSVQWSQHTRLSSHCPVRWDEENLGWKFLKLNCSSFKCNYPSFVVDSQQEHETQSWS